MEDVFAHFRHCSDKGTASSPTKKDATVDFNSPEHITQLASGFWTDLSMHEPIPAWDSMKLTDLAATSAFEKEYMLRRFPNAAIKVIEPEHTPGGVMLHGGQGTGKSAMVYSFCKHFGVKLVEITGSIKQAYQGQTEK